MQAFEPSRAGSTPNLALDGPQVAVALEEGRLELFFDVAWSALSLAVDSVEATAVLTLPGGAKLSGPDLRQAASLCGLELELDRLVTAHAVDTAAELAGAGLGITVSFSVSPRSLGDPHFVDRLLTTTQRYGLAPGQVAIDLDESVLMTNLEYSLNVLRELRASGVRTAINDFGLAPTSPYWLARLPLSLVKISGDLLPQADRLGRPLGMVRCLATYGHALGLLVMAKGVQTHDQLAGVKAAGVDVVQGPIVTRPLSADALPRFLGCSHRTAGAGSQMPT
jgi:EAL domain-containing protein (putative c-di-GMP-specific phosphodiesterase class I)